MAADDMFDDPDMAAAPRVQDLTQYKVDGSYRGRSKLYVQLWWIVQSTLFAWSPQPLYKWRAMLLRWFGCKVGEGTFIRQSVRITYPWKVTIGDRCQIGDNAELYSLGEISIGADAVVSQRSYICTGSHDHKVPGFTLFAQPIRIEEEAWVCADVFVHPGLTVGRGAVIASRSTLTRDAEPYGIYVGNPAERRGDRRKYYQDALP